MKRLIQRWRVCVAVSGLMFAGLTEGGCTPSAAGSVAPGAPAGPAVKEGTSPRGPQEGDTVPELTVRLQRLLGEQESVMADALGDAKSCQDLCALSASICEVQVKLCDIADRHPQESAYQDLCRDGRQECREAQSSCERCVETHQGESGS